jgi:hypothetical protein
MVIPFLVLVMHRLRKIPFVGRVVDERFMSHRQRALKAACLLGFVVADLLFGYRYLVNRIVSWDLLAVVLTIAGTYLVLIVWFLFAE